MVIPKERIPGLQEAAQRICTLTNMWILSSGSVPKEIKINAITDIIVEETGIDILYNSYLESMKK